ncbi:polyphosphate:AMP phosphotransferase [Xanthobacter sp. TB0139]|uniref:polyphosphate:AMP phosphotransferase n=1 Tax=Xanthobacter sp. TB0139 TaxID=3459178 RepID=UPI00403A407D
MFESAKVEHTLDKAAFKALEPGLREELLNLQFQLIDQNRRSLLVLIHGPDGAGKGAVLNRLYDWLDIRKLDTLTYKSLCHRKGQGEERRHPPMWKYWRGLPPFGDIGLMLGSWYHEPLCRWALEQGDDADLTSDIDHIRRFEAMLDSEGVSLLKIWLYLDHKEARKRLKALTKGAYKRPVVREWEELDSPKARARVGRVAEEVARSTSTDYAPWQVVPASDANYRDATIGGVLLEKLRRMTAGTMEMNGGSSTGTVVSSHNPSALPHFSILSTLDLSQKLEKKDYEVQLAREQHRITVATSSKAFAERGLVIAFEGSDAAGKSSAIMRLREALDPRYFRVYPIAAPTDEERARPYLWRFWRRILSHGQTAIFDRSWYGRVLVERVEKLCSHDDWSRAYGEINDFEAELSDSGLIVVKFWLAISQDEQARRFEARETVPYKRFKLTPEDWRNRAKWPLYEAAVTEMVDRTSTRIAPWTLVEAEDKRFARVKVLRTIADRLEEALGG